MTRNGFRARFIGRCLDVIGQRLDALQDAAGVIVGFEKRDNFFVQNLLHARFGQSAAHAVSGFDFDAMCVGYDQKQNAVIQLLFADTPSVEKRGRKRLRHKTIGSSDRHNSHFRARAALQCIDHRIQTIFRRGVDDVRHVTDPRSADLARIYNLRERFRPGAATAHHSAATARHKQQRAHGHTVMTKIVKIHNTPFRAG